MLACRVSITILPTANSSPSAVTTLPRWNGAYPCWDLGARTHSRMVTSRWHSFQAARGPHPCPSSVTVSLVLRVSFGSWNHALGGDTGNPELEYSSFVDTLAS